MPDFNGVDPFSKLTTTSDSLTTNHNKIVFLDIILGCLSILIIVVLLTGIIYTLTYIRNTDIKPEYTHSTIHP